VGGGKIHVLRQYAFFAGKYYANLSLPVEA